MAEHPRLVLRDFLSPVTCKNRNWSSYIKAVAQLVTDPMSSQPHSLTLLLPTLPISSYPSSPSERLKEKVEEHFGCEYELFVEFTGLISWCMGASIGWHSDDNRDYLKQRDFAL
ncbi:hypothetical protein OROMI_017303 [Orobanche minor]